MVAPQNAPGGSLTISIDASQHIVQSVTVFRNDTAQVARTFHDLKLKSGENIIMIDNLPHAMQPESLRVSNSGSYAILDILCAHERNDEHERRLEATVIELEQSKKRREEVMKILRDYGNSLAPRSTSRKNIFKFTKKYLSVAEECDAEVRSIEEKLKAEKASLETWRNSRMSLRGVAQITLFTTRNASAALAITYMVHNASWSPLYDLRATSQKGKPSTNVHLHYRANLSQSTGEDWNDAQLTLSTRAPEDLDGGIPKASTIQIRGASPERYVPSPFLSVSITPIPGHTYGLDRLVRADGSPPRRRSSLRRGFENRILRSPSPRRRRRRSVTPYEPPRYHPNETVAIANDVTSVSYIMDGRCSIPGDGKLHRVTFAILPFTATIHHVITPRVSSDAYLQCSIPNDSNYTLLPGVLSTFLDDKYVSKTTIPEVGTGDTFRCTLGIDATIKVNHSITSTTSTSPEAQSVERLKTTTYTSKTTIRNRRVDGEAIDVVERTSLPVVRTRHGDPVDPGSVEARIRVLLKQPPGLAEAETSDQIELDRPDGFCVQWGTGDGTMGPQHGSILDKEEGKFMWKGKVGPGGEVVLESVWDVRAPIDISWSENTVPP
ncbi:hypothetical protein BDM02DRAFT_3096089 [Thelephora ganbajun]|uniref:Uncharacterized protein n=1 Tax=Thelephora ganbajun TaxID=370292 RepID=A0ACB6ZFR5_THEGA|nr:hypothetical protein BDM02DRAFT_3096089 [Thelephora ganbajun]